MIKKALSMILCLSLVSGVLCGCGSEDSTPVSGSAIGSDASGENESTNQYGSLLDKESNSNSSDMPEADEDDTSLLGSLFGGEPDYDKVPDSFIQQGSQMDGGEFHGLNWIYTDANELIITGKLEEGYPEDGSWSVATHNDNGSIVPTTYYAPWGQYADKTEIACLAFTGAKSLSRFFDGFRVLQSVDVSVLDTKDVSDMSHMFNFCESLSSLDLSGIDTCNVTDMSYMFESCKSLSSLDLSGIDTCNVTDMSYMFFGCSGLFNLDLSHFDTRSVMEMGGMFYGCTGWSSWDLSHFDFTSSAGTAILSDAKLLKEQTRAKNRETLLEIINSQRLTEEQKQAAVDSLAEMDVIAEKEAAAEILLEAKGFPGAAVAINGNSVEVVIYAEVLDDAMKAQIEDIVESKTEISAENIIISTVVQ